MNLDQIEKEVFIRKGKYGNSKFLNNLVHEIEYSMLLFDEFPEEVFNFYLRVLSDTDLRVTKGVEWFVHHLYSDFKKIKAEQFIQLKEVLIKTSNHKMTDELRFVILDLFLRKFNYQDMRDMKKIVKGLNFSAEDNDIVYAIEEMIQRYKLGLMKDIN
ncbi:hypothetical protein [Acinetobacter lanii]|uniref:Immunity protein 30 domain-containing protein n=1 Tax=Acinetobacter lanii TaxID=2715163 RepID=A0A6G8S3P7_9GAMM|nr:hypothetical protein [Acinetobacter lanii]QIO08761.1 hypothetical protein G8D99_06815 [Acinetobacter lanii]